eukprot:Selendium_serpulae@DN4853_c0_g1_i2.p1
MSNENITYLGIGRIKDQALIASAFDRISGAEKTEIETAFAHFLMDTVSRFGPGSREKRSFGGLGNTMFLLADKQLCCLYAAAVRGNKYPDRVAYAMLEEVIRVVGEQTGGQDMSRVEPGRLSKPLRKPLKDLMDKYDKPANVDKTSEVQAKVDDVKVVMQDNMKKVLENHEDISRLEDKTDNLNQQAQQVIRLLFAASESTLHSLRRHRMFVSQFRPTC